MSINEETLRLLAGMRVALDATVDAATRDLVRAWAVGWDELTVAWDAAVADLVAGSRDGAWPSRAAVMRAERVLKALDATRDSLTALADGTGVRVLQDVTQVTADAATWHARMTAAQMPAAAGSPIDLTATLNRLDPRALAAIVERTTSQVTALTQPLSEEATAAVQRELIRGVALGDNPRVAARRMVGRLEGRFNGGLTRALTIARTEMLDAHRAGGHAQDQANAAVLGGWQWVAALDARTCPSCWSQHGSRHPVDEVGPLDHQQGRCARVPVTKTWRELGFDLDEPASALPDAETTFRGLPEAEQLAVMGPQRLALLRSGEASWSQLSARRSTDGWRDSFTVTPLRDLAAA